MAHYKLYCLEDAKPIMRTEDFEAQSDEEAITIARTMKKKVNCELWSLDRLVARIPAQAGEAWR
jgi:hypothetical protein